jgi:putative ABC transport system permease protein
VFQVFDIPLLAGDGKTALAEPNSIVITEDVAMRYFGDEDPLGKTLQLEQKIDLKVTGVMKALPYTSHFHINCFISYSTLKSLLTEQQLQSFYWNPSYTYLLLKDETNETANTLASLLPGFIDKYFAEVDIASKALPLQRLDRIHLYSSYSNELAPGGSVQTLIILGSLAALILLLAVINFVNLTIARALTRAREVGVRKVVGASREKLILQFLAEVAIIILISIAIAGILITVFLPSISTGLQISLHISHIPFWLWVVGLIGLLFFLSLTAGLYPAFYLSGFKSTSLLKGRFTDSKAGLRLRKGLLIFQFAICAMITVGALHVNRQLNHMRNVDLGLDKEQVIIIPIQRSLLGSIESFRLFRDRLLILPRVSHVTAMEDVLGKGYNAGSYQPEGVTEELIFPRLFVREDFVQTFGLTLLAGKTFSDNLTATSSIDEVIINEEMLRTLNWSAEEAIGRKLGQFKRDTLTVVRTVVGVVKNFHAQSLHRPIEPFVLQSPPVHSQGNSFFIKYLAVKVSGGDLPGSVERIRNEWNNFVHDKAFEFSFLDETLNASYQSEARLQQLTFAGSALALFVGMLGILGLVMHAVQLLKKEIAIRKVLGSTTSQIISLFASKFLWLIVFANAIAAPLSYWLVSTWLRSFSYRIEFVWMYGLVACGVALLLAGFVILYHSLRASLIDPAKTLREAD